MSGKARKPKVLVACCNGDGWIHKLVAFAAIRMLGDPRVEATFIAPTWSPFVQNLHKTTIDFLAGGFDFLLLMDDDNPPNGCNPLDLAFLDLDVVGLPTPVWHSDKRKPGDRPYYLNALREVVEADGSVGFKPLDSEPGFRPAGIQRADAVGTGCVMIARRVLLTLMENAKGNPSETPFMRRWNDRGEVVMGNDYAFCSRARAAGFEVWAHFDYTCRHLNTLEIVETVNALMRHRLEGRR